MTISTGEMDDRRVKSSSKKSKFKRFKIPTEVAPHRYDVPHPFLPKVNKLGLAKLLLSEVFEYNFKLLKKEYRGTLLSRPCIYGVFGGRLGGFSPVQEKCVGCMRCVQEYPDVCTVDRNPEFTHFADSYWMPDDPNNVSESPFGIVWEEARTGSIPVKGMGYKGLFAGDGFDAMWTDMSEIVRPTRDGVYGREFISTQVDIGNKPERVNFNTQNNMTRVFSTPIPMIFDYLPEHLNSASILRSMQKSAEMIGTGYIVDVDNLALLDMSEIENMIPLVSQNNLMKYEELLSQCNAIQITNPDPDAIQFLKSLNPRPPIISRLRVNEQINKRIDTLIMEGIDAVHLVFDYHGHDYSTENNYVKDVVHDIHTELVEKGQRDKISLIVSGGIILAEHVPKIVIMGADAVAINTSALVALQVKFDGQCKVPENSSISETEFDTAWGQQRLTNLLSAWHNQIIEIMSAMGIKEIRRLRGDTGRAMTRDELEKRAFGDIEIWEGPL